MIDYRPIDYSRLPNGPVKTMFIQLDENGRNKQADGTLTLEEAPISREEFTILNSLFRMQAGIKQAFAPMAAPLTVTDYVGVNDYYRFAVLEGKLVIDIEINGWAARQKRFVLDKNNPAYVELIDFQLKKDSNAVLSQNAVPITDTLMYRDTHAVKAKVTPDMLKEICDTITTCIKLAEDEESKGMLVNLYNEIAKEFKIVSY